MRYSTTIVLAALSVGQTMAGPTHAHLHRHRDVHVKKDAAPVDWDALDWDDMGINWSSAWAAGQTHSTTAPAAVPTTASPSVGVPATVTSSPPVLSSSAPSPSAIATSSSISSEVGSIVETAFSNIKGIANDFTEFGTPTVGSGSDIGSIGNTGSPPGSNMIKVSSTEGYDYTNRFINTSGKPMTIVVWNKAASQNGGPLEANLGSCIASTSPTLSFTLASGGEQIVAFQANSQGAFSEATTEIAASGAFAITWGEFNYGDGNGYDVSAIMNVNGNNYNMSITAEEGDCESNMNENMWIAQNNNPEDPVPVGTSDGSCYLPGTSAHLTTKMGGIVA